jgi:hypothetical protein
MRLAARTRTLWRVDQIVSRFPRTGRSDSASLQEMDWQLGGPQQPWG